MIVEEYIFKKGKEYRFSGLEEKGLVYLDKGQCFDNCLSVAMKRDDLRYVEGLAEDPLREGEWIWHSWLTDGVRAFDVTWRMEIMGAGFCMPTRYIGVEIDIFAALEFVWKTEYASIILNAWRNKGIAKKALPKGFPVLKIENKRVYRVVS